MVVLGPLEARDVVDATAVEIAFADTVVRAHHQGDHHLATFGTGLAASLHEACRRIAGPTVYARSPLPQCSHWRHWIAQRSWEGPVPDHAGTTSLAVVAPDGGERRGGRGPRQMKRVAAELSPLEPRVGLQLVIRGTSPCQKPATGSNNPNPRGCSRHCGQPITSRSTTGASDCGSTTGGRLPGGNGPGTKWGASLHLATSQPVEF